VAIFLASNTTTTSLGLGTIIERHMETLTSAFTLGRALGCFSIVEAAFFAFVLIRFYCSFNTFLAAAACSLASFSLAALAFFSAVSFAFFSFSSLFLRAFIAL
jgi:hypothetical protein